MLSKAEKFGLVAGWALIFAFILGSVAVGFRTWYPMPVIVALALVCAVCACAEARIQQEDDRIRRQRKADWQAAQYRYFRGGRT